MRSGAAVLAVLFALGFGACRERAGPGDGGQVVNPGPLPEYRAVAEGYNRRLVNLDRLWTYTSVRFWVVDEEGKERTEVLDGRLQLILPLCLSLRLDKVNSTYALLGSNAERYWWIELGDEPRAFWGAHAAVSDETLARVGGEGGLPVHPLDMIELLGITPLPMPGGGVGVGDEPEVSWSADGRWLRVTVPGRVGLRRIWVDPATFEASKVELLHATADGMQVAAWSDVSGHVRVEMSMNRIEPLMPGRITMHLPGARVELRIDFPKNDGRRPKEDAFEFERLLKQYRVRRVECVDDPRPEGVP
jgi:hypothetical protein